MSRGFTLVELAIVLVIIGLLIGGILVAQSMVSTTKIQSAVRQLQQFDSAVSNFQTKYDGLPGDSSAMGCTTGANTCDDGKISEDSSLFYNNSYFHELANFWPHLQQSGLTSEKGVTYSSANAITFASFDVNSATPNSPKFILGTKTGIIITRDNNNYNAARNYYFLANFSGLGTSGSTSIVTTGDATAAKSITAVEALALDTKIDDGLPMRSPGGIARQKIFLPHSSYNNVNCSTPDYGGSYNVGSSSAMCTLVIAIGSTNGMAD